MCWIHFRLWNFWIQTDPVDGRGIEKINETLTHIKFFRQDRLLSTTATDFNVDCDWAPTWRLDFCTLLPKSPAVCRILDGIGTGQWPTAFSSWYLDGGNSNIFLFSPRFVGFHDPTWWTRIFFKWAQPPTRYVFGGDSRRPTLDFPHKSFISHSQYNGITPLEGYSSKKKC